MKAREEVDFAEYSLEDEIDRNMAKHKGFFAELLSYYISGRYPMYKQKVSEGINADRAVKTLNTSGEVFLWLESLSRYKL
jgi:HEPN domain-containing protein